MKIVISFLYITFSFSLLFGQVSYNQEFQVNTYTLYRQEQPTVTALSDSGFVVCWASYGQDGSGHGIFGQMYNSNAEKKGPEFQVNTTTDDDQWQPSVGKLNNGKFIVCWTRGIENYATYGIYGEQ